MLQANPPNYPFGPNGKRFTIFSNGREITKGVTVHIHVMGYKERHNKLYMCS